MQWGPVFSGKIYIINRIWDPKQSTKQLVKLTSFISCGLQKYRKWNQYIISCNIWGTESLKTCCYVCFCMYIDPEHWHVKIRINSLFIVTRCQDPKRSKNNCKNYCWLYLEIRTFSRSKININNLLVIANDTRKNLLIVLDLWKVQNWH